MFVSDLLQQTLARIAFTVVLVFAVLLDDRFGRERDDLLEVRMHQSGTQHLMMISDLAGLAVRSLLKDQQRGSFHGEHLALLAALLPHNQTYFRSVGNRWQLSHGERSRLFLALLQGADMLVLDETFAALDPETLLHTLPRVIARAPTLLVIAHP